MWIAANAKCQLLCSRKMSVHIFGISIQVAKVKIFFDLKV